MADSFVSKEYLQKQFQNYSTVVKDNFEKKGAVTAETLKYSNINKPIVDTVKSALDLLFKEGGGGGDSSVTLTQEEYEALTEEEKLNGLYYTYDTKRIYKNGVQYGASEPIPLTMAEYEALKEAGAIDEQQEYLIEADDEGILIDAEDIGYNNAKSSIQATTVQGAIDKIAKGGMSNFITLMTLGAVNDGITDNTEVVKKAVQYCKEKNKDLYIEQGTYLIKDRIIIDFPLRIQGSNIDNTKLLFELPEPSTETKYDDTYWEESNSAFIIKSDNAAISNLTIQNKNLEDRRWNGIIFHYPKTKDDGSKFYASSERCELSSLDIRNFKSGIFIYGGWSRNISMSKILDCTYGIKYEALENINWSTSGDMISNCYIAGSKEYGLYANKTFETSVEGVIFEYNKVPIYCANALDTIFTNCWNEANTNGIEIDGNVKFVNGYNITNETIHQTENGIVFIEKPNDIMALRANEVIFHQVDGIIVKGVSLGSKTINLIKNSSFGTIADKNFNGWTVDAPSITTISNTETYKDNNSVFFDFHEGWGSDPFYGITTDVISVPKGDYKFSFAFKSPDRSTIDNKAKYLIMKLNSEGTVVDYLANEDFIPNGDNVWEIVSKAISITDETASIKIKIQVNRNGLLYISTPVFADADISSDSLSLKNSGVEGIITVVNQNGTEVNQIYTASKITSLETDVTEINSNLRDLEFEGWTIPDGMPLKDISKVGRVDLSTLTWNYDSTNNRYTSDDISNSAKFVDDATVATNLYCTTQHTNKSANDVWAGTNGVAIGSTGTIWYKSESISSTVKPSGYLYYELATAKPPTDQNAFDKVNESLVEQKMLGWNVPAECPVQNIVSNEVFTQKVGRVDLGNLDWSYSSEYKRFSTSGITDYKKKDSSTNTWVADAFLKGYSTTSGNNTASDSYNKSIGFNGTSNMFFVKNTSYTDTTTFKNAMQGKYLYYELETEISMNVDGNESVTKVNESLDDYGMDNKCSDLVNGYYNADDGSLITNYNPLRYICSTNSYYLKKGETIRINSNSVDSIYLAIYNTNNLFINRKDYYDKKDVTYIAQDNIIIKWSVSFSTDTPISQSPYIGVYINNAIDKLKNDLSESKSRLDNISIDTIDRELGEITFKGIGFSAELTLLKIGNQLELLRGQIHTVGNFFSVTSKDELSFNLSVSEFGDYIKGLGMTSKLAFSRQGIFASKVIGTIYFGEYTSSSGDEGIKVMLSFNDSYEFSSANVRSGMVQFDF